MLEEERQKGGAKMKEVTIVAALSAVLIVTGCAKRVEERKKYGPEGTLVERTYKEDEKVLDDLKRILEKETIRGMGKFKDENEAIARVAATNLAINDLAARAGEVVASQDVTLYNDKVYSVIRTQARNIVKGYDVIYEKWDHDKKEYEVMIEMRGYKIAEEIHKYIKY